MLAPSSPPLESDIENSVRYLEKLGYRVEIGSTLTKAQDYTAGSAADRAYELMDFVEDENIDAIFCIRGGFGAIGILPYLDFRLFIEHPKLIVGYSDVTAIQLSLWSKCRLPSVSGFMPASDLQNGELDSTAESWFWDFIESGQLNITFDGCEHWRTQSEVFSGVALGGNLSVASKLLGSDYFPAFKDSFILFLEDVGESMHKYEGYLYQWRYSGVLDQCRGLMLGDFGTAEVPEYPSAPNLKTVCERVLSPYRFNIVAELPFGHIDRKFPIPIGCQVSLSSTSKTTLSTEHSIYVD